MAEARQNIKLTDLGLETLGFRIEDCIFEISEANGFAKTDQLVEQLRALYGKRAIKVRPVKTADSRLTGLDDSVTTADLMAAIITASASADQHPTGAYGWANPTRAKQRRICRHRAR